MVRVVAVLVQGTVTDEMENRVEMDVAVLLESLVLVMVVEMSVTAPMVMETVVVSLTVTCLVTVGNFPFAILV